MVFCSKCGKENADDARFCMHCGAQLLKSLQHPHPAPDVVRDIKRATGKVVETTVEVTGKVAKAIKPAAKKGYEATKTAVKETGKAVKKAGRKLQDKE